MGKKTLLVLVLASSLTVGAFAENIQNHSMMNGSMNHNGNIGLSEAGNDAFGTIQEVITKLNNDPQTDWSKVNMEALRAHLVDMQDMTFNISVVSQRNIPNGVEIVIKATTKRADIALKRVFQAHPAQLKRETGWDMKVKPENQNYIITATTTKENEIDKVRGLSYIGLMAYGGHHQPHHWMMATGKNPHK